MAVSKTQNERPAIIALIDLANALEIASNTHAQNISTLTEGLADEVSDRESADTALGDRIDTEIQQRVNGDSALGAIIGDGFTAGNTITSSFGALSSAVNSISEELGNGFDDTNTVAAAVGELSAFTNRFRFGSFAGTEVSAGSSVAHPFVFDTPFPENATVCIFTCCTGNDEIFTNLECILISSTNTGFTAAIRNNDTDSSHTVGMAYVAVQVN